MVRGIDISTNLGTFRVVFDRTVTECRDVTYDDSTRQDAVARRPVWTSIIAAMCLAALLGLGTWLATSLVRSSDSVTEDTSELTASQHTEHLVRVLRISAASGITPPQLETIPEAAVGNDVVTCGSRYAEALEQAALQLHGIDYFSTVAGARDIDTQVWRSQQSQAHDSALALQGLFPPECAPVVPVTFAVPESFRHADGMSTRHMLKISDDIVAEWSQLYLLAETAPERELALAGLWQSISWEAAWQPGRSPFAFVR